MYRRNNPLKIGKGYQEEDLLTLRVKLTVARVEYCERDKNYFSCSTICTYIHWWYIYSCWKKWTNLDDLSPVLLATFNRFDVYETRKMFSSHRRFFSNAWLFPSTWTRRSQWDETMFREIFLPLDYYKIIAKNYYYRSRLEGTIFIYTTFTIVIVIRIIKRVDALFLTERIQALHALHACTVSSRELDSTSWTNSSTRFSLSLFLSPMEEKERLLERTMLLYFHESSHESANPKSYFLKWK